MDFDPFRRRGKSRHFACTSRQGSPLLARHILAIQQGNRFLLHLQVHFLSYTAMDLYLYFRENLASIHKQELELMAEVLLIALEVDQAKVES